mgnify:CR=1 FL=1
MVQRGYAIIRGGCSGVGREISLRLAKEGYDIVGNFADKNQAYKGEALVKDVEALGRRCIVHNGDLREQKNVVQLVALARESFGDDLAVFINNGGIFDGKRLPDLDVWEYEELTAIHINALLHCVREVYPLMGKTGGSFINITAVAEPPIREQMDYTLEWSLFQAFTRSLAKTLEPYGVRFNSILSAMVPAPGESPPPPPEPDTLAGPGHDRMCGPFSDKGDTDEITNCMMQIIHSLYMNGQVISPDIRL